MKYLKKFKLYESYSEHKYHHEKLDDLLDSILFILDEYGVVECNDRLLNDRVSGESLSMNWRFGYANDNKHMKDALDNITISSISSFKLGQDLLLKLQNSKHRIEKMIGQNIVIETSDSIMTDSAIDQYLKEMGDDVHPYIQVSILPEGEKHDSIRYK